MKRCISLILTLSLLLSGCSGSIFTNYREIEQMQLIQTLGVDRIGNRLSVSVSGGHSSETTKLNRMTAAGPSMLSAMELLQDYTASEQLYYAHTRYVLLGETVVQDALPELIDYMARSPQLRSDIPVLIVRNGTAGDLVLRCGQEDTDITDALKSIIRDSQRRGDCTIFTLQSLISDVAESKAALLAAVEPRPLTDTEPQAEPEEITPILTGYGILKDTKLAGYLDLEDARGVNYLRNKTGTESITLPQVGQAGQVTLTLTRSRVKTAPVFAADGRITGIHVTVRAAAFVEEMEHPEELDRSDQSLFRPTDPLDYRNPPRHDRHRRRFSGLGSEIFHGPPLSLGKAAGILGGFHSRFNRHRGYGLPHHPYRRTALGGPSWNEPSPESN